MNDFAIRTLFFMIGRILFRKSFFSFSARMTKVVTPKGVNEVALDADPIELTADFIDEELEAYGGEVALATALATVDPEGMPDARFILLKGIDRAATSSDAASRGYVFYTNYHSQKSAELMSSGKAAVSHWNQQLGRAFRVRGLISKASQQESDEYFATRPRASQISAWASQQSQPLESLEELQAAYAAVEAKFADVDIPRPPHWGGWRIIPTSIEFWWDRRSRLHERVQFTRSSPDARWERTLLYP